MGDLVARGGQGFELEPLHTGRGVRSAVRDARRVLRTVRADDFDVVHLNPSFRWRALVRDGCLLLALRGVGCRRVVVFVHGWDTRLADRIARSGPSRAAFRLVFGRASAIVVLGTAYEATMVRLGIPPGRVHRLTTGFDSAALSGVRRERPDSGVRVLFLSRLVEDKGVFALLDAFGRLCGDWPHLHLMLAGDGPARRELERRVAQRGWGGRVTLPGYLRGADKARALADADLFALPSWSEGCPVSLLEAMAAGLPVVATDTGGIADVVDDGVNGVLLQRPDAASIVLALDRLLRQPELRARMASRNRADAVHYEVGAVVERLEAVYRATA